MDAFRTRLSSPFPSELTSSLEQQDFGDDERQLQNGRGSPSSGPRTPRAPSLLSLALSRSNSSNCTPSPSNVATGFASGCSEPLDLFSTRGTDSPLRHSSSTAITCSAPLAIPETTYYTNPAHIEQRSRLHQLRVWHRAQMELHDKKEAYNGAHMS